MHGIFTIRIEFSSSLALFAVYSGTTTTRREGNPGARVTLALAHILDRAGRKFAILILQNLRV